MANLIAKAPLISMVVGIGSFLIALIVNREKVFGFLKSNWKIVTTVVLGGAGVFAYLSGYLPWINSTLQWLCHTVALPAWAIFGITAVLLIAVVAGSYLGYLVICDSARQKQNQPQRSSYYDYVTDEIFGVVWAWSYVFGELRENTFNAFCPRVECQCRLDTLKDYERAGRTYARIVPVTLRCPRCGFRYDYDTEFDQLVHGVAVEVERRVRTGEFRKNLNASHTVL